jgi:pyrroloquinoline quinone biosynthesis protein E
MTLFYHPPGELSRTGVLDVGLKCTHSCKFCYYSFLDGDSDQFHGMRHAKFRDGAKLWELITNLQANGFLGFDVTGGEPTLHPNLVDLVGYATEIGLYSRVITLGQFLMRTLRQGERPLIDELLSAGLTNFLFSFHSCEAAEFQALTGGSLNKQLAAMDYLAEREFQFSTNTVVVAENTRRIPDIARRLVQTNTYLHNFIIMNAYYSWSNGDKALSILPHYSELLPLLQEAVDILAAANMACNIRYAPFCGLPGLEKHIVGVTGVRYDPYEWMNQESHSGEADPVRACKPWSVDRGGTQQEFRLYGIEGAGNGDPSIFAVRGAKGSKVFPKTCRNCAFLMACDGFDPKYLTHFGQQDICPYNDPGIDGALTTSRRSYVPAFLVKTSPGAQMRQVNQRFLNPAPLASQPKVTIVITAYNKADTVARALVSALNQTYRNLDIVVVDDGSTDDTVELLEAGGLLSDPRVRLHRQPNSGQPATARNAGVLASDGALILPLDADDWIVRTYVAEAVALLRQNPSISIAYCDAQYSRQGLVKARDYNFSTLIYANHLSYCSLFKREVFTEVGGYRTNVRGVEDWDFWVAAGSRGHFGKRIPRALFHYTESDTGVFAQDVANNREAKFARLVLNNRSVYQPAYIQWARARLQQSTVAVPEREFVLPLG